MRLQMARAVTRWITMLGLGLWLGGILFLGAVSAPAIFRFCRAHGVESLAPQIVGALVERFGPLSAVLGVVLCLAWLAEGIVIGKTTRKVWLMQGCCLSAMLVLALYLNFVALPELLLNQAAVIRESASNGTPLTIAPNVAKSAARLHFDALHQRYSQLTMLIFWLGAAVLALFSWRLSRDGLADRE